MKHIVSKLTIECLIKYVKDSVESKLDTNYQFPNWDGWDETINNFSNYLPIKDQSMFVLLMNNMHVIALIKQDILIEILPLYFDLYQIMILNHFLNF